MSKSCHNYANETRYRKGLGHAILCAKPLIGKEPFTIVLPDVVIDQYSSNLKEYNLIVMLKRYHETSASQILVESIPKESVSNYGVVDCDSYELKAGESKIIRGIVEKLKIELAPSNLFIVGRYVLSETIWFLLEKTPMGQMMKSS